jgi:Domain of unknown function (DUF4136)
MLKTGLILVVLSVGGAVAGCAHTNAHTNARTDFDPSADFARYHTYYWAGGKEASGRSSLENSLIDKRIKDIIGTQLWARGFGEVAENAKPDLVVLYWIGAKDKTSVEGTPASTLSAKAVWNHYDPYWGGRWGRTYDEVVLRNYTEGTLIVDLIDTASKALAWRAYLVQTLDEDPQKTARRAEANAMTAFAQYPPARNSP